jgi:pectinesterase
MKQMEVIVDAQGSGDYTTVQEAVNAVPDYSETPVTLRIKAGVYREKLTVPKEKTNIRMIGDGQGNTILCYADNAHTPGPDGQPLGTFRCGSFYVHAADFHAEGLTIANTSGPKTGQAVAAFIDADRAMFRHVSFIGDQDTLYTGNGRHYYEECYIEGDVDFIFGAATAVFDRCHLHCKRSTGGYLTAASTPSESPYGYVFLDCRVTGVPGAKGIYLGRPWRDYASVAFIRTWLDEAIIPQGWHNWSQPHREETSRYAEYASSGPGAGSERVAWARALTDAEAEAYTVAGILSGWDGWTP